MGDPDPNNSSNNDIDLNSSKVSVGDNILASADSSTDKKVTFSDEMPRNIQDETMLSDLSSNYKVKLKMKDDEASLKPSFKNLEIEGLRRSPRTQEKKNIESPTTDNDGNLHFNYFSDYISMPTSDTTRSSFAKAIFYLESAYTLADSTVNDLHIFSFAAKHEENETYTY